MSSHGRSYPPSQCWTHWCKVTVLLVTSLCLIAPVITFQTFWRWISLSSQAVFVYPSCSNVCLSCLDLPRFIQEIEMNMGPGQAKQCQLRAFLTYYINDLFLNQVSKMTNWCLFTLSDRVAYQHSKQAFQLSQKIIKSYSVTLTTRNRRLVLTLCWKIFLKVKVSSCYLIAGTFCTTFKKSIDAVVGLIVLKVNWPKCDTLPL